MKAENSISIQGGSFTPWEGNDGGSIALQYAHRFGSRNYIGVEFEYRKFEAEIFNLQDVDLQSFDLRVIYRLDLLLGHAVTPYLGVGFGASVHKIDDPSRVERRLAIMEPGSIFDVSRVGGGIGALALLGLDFSMPRVEWFSLFVEARVGYSLQFTNIEETDLTPGLLDGIFDTDTKVDNLGGISGQAGIRFHF